MDTMTRSHHPPTLVEETGPRDRTRSALVPTVAFAVLLAVALLAVAYPVAVGLATLGLGSTAAVLTIRR